MTHDYLNTLVKKGLSQEQLSDYSYEVYQYVIGGNKVVSNKPLVTTNLSRISTNTN
ncbi:hypothetical protein [Agarivorans sp. Toyoura001]|uniref:hypothetical protein n=1 Tax=unclassified Agarivorans TaxID=2636026 RepID=UPI0010EA0362|nr:hypothetical protein [Agarivorans sp. Toyoura001]GDY28071.1 hypothetical protein AHAT_39610 [Agarivorans sp. Toyoura001]